MPPSKPSSMLPSKKRRASSVSATMSSSNECPAAGSSQHSSSRPAQADPDIPHEERAATDVDDSSSNNNNARKDSSDACSPRSDHHTLPPPNNGGGKNSIHPHRLPSKKRKNSQDSAASSQQPSGKSARSTESASAEANTSTKASSTKNTNHRHDKDPTALNLPSMSQQPASRDASSQGRKSSIDFSRKPSVDKSLRKLSVDTLSTPTSSPGRVRLRSASQASLDDGFGLRKWSQDTSGGGSSSLDPFGLVPSSFRKGSLDTTNTMRNLDILLDLPPPDPMLPNDESSVFGAAAAAARPRSNSTASLVQEENFLLAASAAAAVADMGGALEHLDALGGSGGAGDDPDAKPAAVMGRDKEAKTAGEGGDDHSSAEETFASAGHRVLMEAIKLAAGGDGGSSQEVSLTATRERLGSWGNGRDRFESFGSALEAGGLGGSGRDRLESWGGMSDLSINFGIGSSTEARNLNAAAAAAAAAVSAAMADSLDLVGDDNVTLPLAGEERTRTESIPSGISMDRDRFNSITSFSESSFLADGAEVMIDLNSIVAAAMAHVGDLAELAGIVETVAAAPEHQGADASETSSVISPMIGAVVEGGAARGRRRPRASSISSRVSVDYEALAVAVDAAQAAAGTFDMNTLGSGKTEEGSSTEGRYSRDKSGRGWRRQLPLKRDRTTSEETEEENSQSAKVSEEEMQRIRRRARKAASSQKQKSGPSSSRKKQSIPLKKRAKRHHSPAQPNKATSSSSPGETPRVSNRAIAANDEFPDLPLSGAGEKSASKGGGQASQKWDSNFDCLIGYIEERRKEETAGLSAEETKTWSWDGNVPTSHKTTDGKALGRWVNNQRSAKAKGNLRADREDRLVQAGLKWSVLSSNSWNETLDELRKYINEQTKQGKKWDGNVPTHYQIKAKANGKFAGEDKNLGRWVNRQRSLFQAGKLRKDRQIALEDLGLKWSMLSSTTWDSMYETLREYVDERKRKEGSWDGNVPANYRTSDNPPRNLGRWINRQRSAYNQGKLKTRYIESLTDFGLKWCVHTKGGHPSVDDLDDDGEGDDDDSVGECNDLRPPPTRSGNNEPVENKAFSALQVHPAVEHTSAEV